MYMLKPIPNKTMYRRQNATIQLQALIKNRKYMLQKFKEKKKKDYLIFS